MKALEVSIVIPNYNGLKLLKKNLPSVIQAAKFKPNKIKEIIIVDDASTDESVTYLKKNFPQIRLFKHTQNRGFSSSVNMGVRMAKSKLVCLLNTDVSVSKNFLTKTLPHFKNEKVFAVSLHEKGYGPATTKFEKGFVEHSGLPEGKKTSNTFWVSGGSGVFKRSIWMRLKGLDEELYSPYYWEDVDISYRATKRGYTLLWEPQSKVIHKHESTIGKIPKQKNIIIQRNQLLFIWKNITSPRLTRRHINGLIRRIARHPGYIRVIYAALKKRGKAMAKRNIEKNKCKISDEAIFQNFI